MVNLTRLLARYSRYGVLLFAGLLVTAPAQAQLRVVTYNTTGPPDAGMDIVLRSIGEETRNGIAKPIDVLLLQEQARSSGLPDAQDFVDLLNGMYIGQTNLGMPITYARGSLIGFGDTTQSIVYRTETVNLLAEASVGTSSGANPQPRAAIRHTLGLDGYASAGNALYIYNSHYKAGDEMDDPANLLKRNTEATAIRTDSNGLGNVHAIYAGDLNLYTAGEPAFQTLFAAGNGRAVDPLGLTDPTPDGDSSDAGDWHNNTAVAYSHSQSPCATSVGGCGVPGGIDDRFDFQLITEELDDGEGLSVIAGSYHAFGNGGNICCNSSINVGSNSVTFPGVSSHSKTQILNALQVLTDHIPVVADYQVPARMEALAGAVPMTLNVGQSFNLGVIVSNIANVMAANGADELDYTISVSGNIVENPLPPIMDMDPALGGGGSHFITLDTSAPGIRSGTITVTSSSQQAHNALVQIPVNYQVVSNGPQPTVVAKWTFETSGPSISGGGTSFGPIAPEVGAGAARGGHASASTLWSSPTGNGSDESFSANTWAVGDYYEFEISTADLSDISLTLDHTSSNSGPKEWGIFYSTSGTGPFTDPEITYSVLANAAPNPTWNPDTYLSQYFHSFDLSGIDALDDQETLFLRLVSISNLSANGGTVSVGGTSRVDNVTISGAPIEDLPGDFNGDGVVDAADYVVWRMTGGTPEEFDTWSANFGRMAPGSGGLGAVPEPGAALLLVVSVCLASAGRGTLRAWTRRL